MNMPEDHRPRRGPYPGVGFTKQVQDVNLGPLYDTLSGEITASLTGRLLGVARTSGMIRGVHLSCLASGKDDDYALSFSAAVKINEVAALATQPIIAHVSGEASQAKTTYSEAADTGITEMELNYAANEFSPGDIISWDFELTRTASPTTEMANIGIVVELEPNI